MRPVVFLFLLLPSIASAFTVSISPTGEVKSPRQFRAVFSEAMIPFGDPRGLAPFAVKCGQAGKGLWEDSRTWIYEFVADVPAGEECVFTGQKNLQSLKKENWDGESVFSFRTGAPAVSTIRPYDGSQIVEDQAFVLFTDGPVDEASVTSAVYVLVEGLPERIPVKVLPEKTKKRLFSDGRLYVSEEEKKKPSLLVQATRALPAGKKVQFVWGKGLRSANGVTASHDQMFAFRTRDALKATFSCQRENAESPCLPMGSFTLSFNEEIPRKYIEQISLSENGKAVKPKLRDQDPTFSYVEFKGPFAAGGKFQLHLPKGLRDENGRPLTNARKFPLAVTTGDFPPLAKFAAPFGILESADPVLPVTLRKVEASLPAVSLSGRSAKLGVDNPAEVIRWVAKVRDRHSNYYQFKNDLTIDLRSDALLKELGNTKKFDLPKPGGVDSFEVVGIPLTEKGLHVVEIASPRLGQSLIGRKQTMYVATAALVTDLGVHLKWGKENSLAWITSLATDTPVAGVSLKVVDCSGTVLGKGKTGDQGTVVFDGLPSPSGVKECAGESLGEFAQGLFVFAEKNGDFSFVHSSWNDGIEPWRFALPYETEGRDVVAHTVFDRTLFRAGQTVHMRHFLRESFLRGLRFKKEGTPNKVVVQHSSGQRFVIPFDGKNPETTWAIPAGARLGTYSVYLTNREVGAKAGADEDSEDSFSVWQEGVFESGEFRVEEFRLPVLTGEIQWPAGALVAPKSVAADVNIRYLSGGGAGGLSVKMRAQAERLSSLQFPAFEDFTFANGGVRVGRTKRETEEASTLTLQAPTLALDQGGGGRAQITGLPAWDLPYQLLVEAEFRDPNGEIQSLARRAKVMPSAALLGIEPDGWVANQEKVKFKAAAVSAEGKPLAGKKISVRWAERKTFSHRKRIVGGFYAYESFTETKMLGEACSGESGTDGLLVCEGKAPATGNLILVGEVAGGGLAHREVWVAGADDWWFPAENNDRVDLLPEKKQYQPGETARLQLRAPFREAEVLVTVEREGILDHFVKKIDAKNPVVEIPILPGYAPNVFFSALAVRGRVGEPKATALVDLAKPAFKLGLAGVDVGWRAHELKVAVAPEKTEYKVREKAKVKIQVRRALDGKAPEDGRVLIAAVDEALLDLRPNQSWNLLEAMMGKRALRVQTSTAQSLVVGKRHFGLKALPSGGGGGVDSARELFDTLLFWKGEAELNSRGEAEVEIPLNDSLSSFRVVAVASEGADRFGTGAGSFRSRQDLMLFSGVAPLAREGDHIRPELTVRNAATAPLDVALKANVNGVALPERKLRLEPGASRPVRWDFSVPVNAESLVYEFSATAGDAIDHLRVTQKVVPALKESTLQATLEQLDMKMEVTTAPPAGMLPGKGRVEVALSPALGSNLAAVKSYMAAYPYHCLEQKVSRAAVLKEGWPEILAGLPQYRAGGLLKYFPEMREGSDVLTVYVLSVAEAAGQRIPDDSLRDLIEGLQNFVNGRIYYSGFIYPAADLALRKLAAMEALSRYNSFDPAMLSTIQADPDTLPMAGLLDLRGLLRREIKIPNREARLKKVEETIRARIHWRGTVLAFSAGHNDDLWWLMGSVDREVNRLLYEVADDPAWKNEVGRLVRGSLNRQKQGVWDLTTANAWGALAMEKYSSLFEKEAVSGTTFVKAGKEGKELSDGKGRWAVPFAAGKAEIKIEHRGGGKPWAFVTAYAAVKLKEPIFKGYKVRRTVKAVEQKQRGRWTVGDVYRVTLEVDAPADMTWVAVTDPIPAGATLLGSGLGRDSALLTGGEKRDGYWPVAEEKSFEGYRAYYQWLPKGNVKLEYTVRLNTAGEFSLPNTRVEAMYSPEMYAEVPNEKLVVAE